MKRILKITAEYVEEWNENEDTDFNECAKDYTFNDWAECDWDNVGRPLDRLIDEGWKITRKKVIKND